MPPLRTAETRERSPTRLEEEVWMHEGCVDVYVGGVKYVQIRLHNRMLLHDPWDAGESVVEVRVSVADVCY